MIKPKAGFVCFGEVNTPREIITKKCGSARKLVESAGIDLVYTEPVTDDPDGKDVKRAVLDLSGQDFDFIIFCIAGWIPSHAVISIANEFSYKPMLLWGLAGYLENGVLVTTADQAGTSALRKTFEDMGYRFAYIYDCIDIPPKIDRVVEFARASRAVSLLRHATLGMMGFRDMNLYTTLYDGVSLRKKIGTEVEVFEMLEVLRIMDSLKPEEVMKVVAKIKENWVFEKKPDEELLVKGVRYYLAIREKVRERGYDAISLIDVEGMKKLEKFPPAMVFMLLSDEAGVTTIPENDVLGAITQLIVKYTTGQCAAYFEFYEFMSDRVLMGVPDFVPSEIVDGPIKVIPTKFGELSEGLLNVSKVKTGEVTLCRLTSIGDRYRMHLLTGTAVEPRRWEEAGWDPPSPQLPGLEILLDVPIAEFAQKVMSQHYIICYGDHTKELKYLCGLLDIEVI